MSSKCILCHCSYDDPTNLGKLMRTRGIYAHYYCVLMSTTITQSGKDHEGIFGFTHKDIKMEIENSKNKTCVYCNKDGATISCFNKKCILRFHFPCGLKNGCSFKFVGAYESHCHQHNAYPKINENLLNNLHTKECIACFDNLADVDCKELLVPQCCKIHLIHNVCAKKIALNSGYFTKCPVCGNVEDFIHGLQQTGVFVPMSDATWEGRGAFSDQIQVLHTCELRDCLCPYGHTYQSNAEAWKLKACIDCGSSAAHFGCTVFETYLCNVCYCVSKAKKQRKVKPYVKLVQLSLPNKKMNPYVKLTKIAFP